MSLSRDSLADNLSGVCPLIPSIDRPLSRWLLPALRSLAGSVEPKADSVLLTLKQIKRLHGLSRTSCAMRQQLWDQNKLVPQEYRGALKQSLQ